MSYVSTITLFVIVTLILLFRKVIFVLLLSPIVRVYFWRKKKIQSLPPPDIKQEVETQPKINPIKAYINGLIRFYIYVTSQIYSHAIRNMIYRHILCMNLGRNVAIYYDCEIRDPYKISIGHGSIIGDHVILDGRNGIRIGSNVNFSSYVSIWTEQHDHRDPWFRCETQQKTPVVIGDRAWLGPNTIILHSVHIGEGAIVAAGAVVTKNVPPFAIVAGIPAKVIGERNHDLRYNLNGGHLPFL